MNKTFSNFTWENEPSKNSPINAENLNKINNAIDIIDSRVVTQESTKLDKTTANTMVKDVTFDDATGIFTITKLNGSVLKLDTKLEKLAVNFSYDGTTQQLVITLEDGTKQYVDLNALITQYEFVDSDTLIFTIGTNGNITATIKSGSITGEMLEPNYLANIKMQVAAAQEAETNAETSATNAATSAIKAAESASSASTKASEAATSANEAINTLANAVKKYDFVRLYDGTNQTYGSVSVTTAGWYNIAYCSSPPYNSIANIYLGCSYSPTTPEAIVLQTTARTKVNDYWLGLKILSCNKYAYNEMTSILGARTRKIGDSYYIDVRIGTSITFSYAMFSPLMHKYKSWVVLDTPTLLPDTEDGTSDTTIIEQVSFTNSNEYPVTTDDLAKAMEVWTMDLNSYSDSTEAQDFLDNYSADLEPYTKYSFAFFTTGVGNLKGGIWFVYGNKATDTYEIQTAKANSSEGVLTYERNKHNGVWGAWIKDVDERMLTTELAKYLPKGGDGTLGSLEITSDLLIDTQSAQLTLKGYDNLHDVTVTTIHEDYGNSETPSVFAEDASTLDTIFEFSANVAQVRNGENVLTDGNSTALIKSNTAPENTEALWYDTLNKVLKQYIDGAWQQ